MIGTTHPPLLVPPLTGHAGNRACTPWSAHACTRVHTRAHTHPPRPLEDRGTGWRFVWAQPGPRRPPAPLFLQPMVQGLRAVRGSPRSPPRSGIRTVFRAPFCTSVEKLPLRAARLLGVSVVGPGARPAQGWVCTGSSVERSSGSAGEKVPGCQSPSRLPRGPDRGLVVLRACPPPAHLADPRLRGSLRGQTSIRSLPATARGRPASRVCAGRTPGCRVCARDPSAIWALRACRPLACQTLPWGFGVCRQGLHQPVPEGGLGPGWGGGSGGG